MSGAAQDITGERKWIDPENSVRRFNPKSPRAQQSLEGRGNWSRPQSHHKRLQNTVVQAEMISVRPILAFRLGR